jgi:transcription elongation factor S-II
MNYTELTNSYRQKTTKFFDNIIKNKYSKLVEESIYNFSEDYIKTNNLEAIADMMILNIYNDKVSELEKALTEHPELINNENDAKTIAFKSPNELYKEHFETINNKQMLEESKLENKAVSSAFKCSKCGESKTEVSQKQTRAGDEPATTFVKCVNCGNKWSFNS